jgi:hypothetical protein
MKIYNHSRKKKKKKKSKGIYTWEENKETEKTGFIDFIFTKKENKYFYEKKIKTVLLVFFY